MRGGDGVREKSEILNPKSETNSNDQNTNNRSRGRWIPAFAGMVVLGGWILAFARMTNED